MKGREIVKAIMEQKAVSNADMAARLQITQAALWDRLNTKKAKDIPSSSLTEMLRHLDYKVIIVPRSTRLPEGGYELTVETDTKSKVDLDTLLADVESNSNSKPTKAEKRIKLTK